MNPQTPFVTSTQDVLTRIHTQVRPLVERLGDPGATLVGDPPRVASYIPELAEVRPDQFGMAYLGLDGTVATAGSALTPFSIQSISKLFALVLAYHRIGDSLWLRVGREPSGNPFNSLVQLEYERGKPRNPLINAGALVVTDMLCAEAAALGASDDPGRPLLAFMRQLSGNEQIAIDEAVADSEWRTADRNRAMAHFIKSFGNLKGEVDTILDVYCRHCAIAMSCVDLARAALFLANGGMQPALAGGGTPQQVLDAASAKRINAVMLTCGTYDAAGDFAYRVGLPAKSGVGGGILAVVPGRGAVCVWSPALEASGNSWAGMLALEMFAQATGWSVF